MIEERFALAQERIAEISRETKKGDVWQEYFHSMASLALKLMDTYEDFSEKEPLKRPLEELRRRNKELYRDLLPENYERCYGNPAYACEKLGTLYGRLFSFLYAELHSQIESVYEQDMEELVLRLELLLEIHQAFACAKEEGIDLPEYEQIRQIVYWFISDYTDVETEKKVRKQLDPKESFARNIVMSADLADLSYLYAYGEYISENEEKLSAYLMGLSKERIKKMADTFTEGYRIGFAVTGKDLSKKRTVNIRYPIGFERVIRQAVKNFEAMGLEAIIYRGSRSIFQRKGVHRIGYTGAEFNRQFLYDHKEDQALYLDAKYTSRSLEELKNAYEKMKDLAAVHGGPACLEGFGEAPFSPEAKEVNCALGPKQQELSVEFASAAGQIVNAYIKGEERSFTIIAFPVPEIGDRFPEIFDAVIEINTLDYMKYQKMQQCLIDILDQCSEVRIKGSGSNETDLTVQLVKLTDPAHQTKFENCVADVNIPVGEVFTSPQLKGTNGLLHVSGVFLNGLEFRDLKVWFTDGMVSDYSCGNFEDVTQGKNYIKENLLFHHDTLPLGEFAIGTNTTAYMAARKFDIAARLPILIAEKTGPHFAVGDTCYSHCEDLKVYNPDGKEIIARDNACSAKRKEDPGKAYFNCHTDITIPFEELGDLEGIGEDGRVHGLIHNGKFVPEGCLDLNRPLESM